MKSEKELLRLLLFNIDMLRTGLCHLATELMWEGKITERERDKIWHYINLNRPQNGKPRKYYYWNSGEKEPRFEWLNQELNKL